MVSVILVIETVICFQIRCLFHLTFAKKEIMIISGTNHVDLYDNRAGVIPYDKIETFFTQNLR